LAKRVAALPPPTPLTEPTETEQRRQPTPIRVYREGDHFVVEGDLPREIVQVTDLTNEEALHRMQKRLRGLGIFKQLKALGAQEGDIVRIGDTELEYTPD